MRDEISSETREHNGVSVTVKWFYDLDMGAPWEEDDGHGIVSEWTTRDKAPGERVLIEDGRSRRFYDVQGSIKLALRDGWDAKPYNENGRETKRQQAAKAVDADFEYLRRWCSNDWCWVGRTVEIDGMEYEAIGESSLWGIDSDSIDEYTEEAFSNAFRYIEEETKEEHDAACRDIVTA